MGIKQNAIITASNDTVEEVLVMIIRQEEIKYLRSRKKEIILVFLKKMSCLYQHGPIEHFAVREKFLWLLSVAGRHV